ncbi:hypothetical protein FZI91_13780 [Mycobacterium sp. CBMA271]|uniref:hypothetical protein n=1 Tax=unclassified Mycobacteroides TaxID=2618759 RepID=UPI0012DF0F11|nr:MULTISPECIES: hypothetical protein [unclassified Mycobacteroides]MUM18804.1 hypothetical protein [Mycobacteroides sp. CBMA 326]MUM22767.1 hypothetical protein [Mycobacteroides sp. CBMA 271]
MMDTVSEFNVAGAPTVRFRITNEASSGEWNLFIEPLAVEFSVEHDGVRVIEYVRTDRIAVTDDLDIQFLGPDNVVVWLPRTGQFRVLNTLNTVLFEIGDL